MLLLAVAVSIGVTALYIVHACRSKSLVDRSQIILRGKMIAVSNDRSHAVIDVIDIDKGNIPGGAKNRILVDIVPRWGGGLDIMPPWPSFQTNRIAVFYLRKSIWSSTYEPILIK